jgi:hypothetical protein
VAGLLAAAVPAQSAVIESIGTKYTLVPEVDDEVLVAALQEATQMESRKFATRT